jgi:dethiobiotin synthetase
MGRLVVVAGTGTEIGKTHVSEALLLSLGAQGRRAAGIKPVESGVGEGVSDAGRLAGASTFHVKHAAVALTEPVSPHRAARLAGLTLDIPSIADAILPLRADLDVLLAELPGGLFTPLSEHAVNADLAARLHPDTLLLVAPDRLGVLHDVLAVLRASAAMSLAITGIVLVAPPKPDRSTGTNAEELARIIATPVLATLRRAAPSALAADEQVRAIARAIT